MIGGTSPSNGVIGAAGGVRDPWIWAGADDRQHRLDARL
jgi:hypothetical protein